MENSKNSTERCVLCLDQKRSPVRIQCGHSFCCGCLTIYKSYKEYPWSSKCPICRHALKEGPVKRKHSEHNVATQNSSNTTAAQIQPLIENHYISSEQTHILEEFMTLAANYFDESHEESDNNLDEFTNWHDNEQDLAENYDSYYDEEQTDFNMDDSDEDEMSFYSDAFESFGNNYYGEDYENYDNYCEDYNFVDNDDYCEDYNFVDNDDYCEDYNFVDNDDYCEDYNFVDNDDSYEPPHSRRHMDSYYDSEEANSFTNGFNDRVAYGVGGGGVCGAFDIDWETVIASDIIIID